MPHPTIVFTVTSNVDFSTAPIGLEIEYRRLLAPPPGEAGDATSVRDTVRLDHLTTLPPVELVDAVPGTPAIVRILDARGAPRIERTVTIGAGRTDVAIGDSDLAWLARQTPALAVETLQATRRGQFAPISGTYPFDKSTLRIVPIPSSAQAWKALGLDALFALTRPSMTAIDAAGDRTAGLVGLAWQPVHLTSAGSFEFTVPVDAGDGWLWWLEGARPIIGFVPDSFAQVLVRGVAIPLPAAPAAAAAAAPTGQGVPPSDTKDACECQHDHRVVPADVTEAQLVENPEIYAEDAGAYCRPFANPERVVSERAFFSVFRVQQPAVSVEGATRTEGVTLLDFDPPQRVAGGVAPSAAGAGVLSRIGAAISGAPSAAAAAMRVVRHAIPRALLDRMRLLDRGRTLLDGRHPVQWEDDAGRYQAATVARGHILEFRVRWRANGYSLGTVVKTLTLAPRQTRRIQKIEWERLERTRREETTRFEEQVSDETTRERTYEDEVQANLSEWARGSSRATTSAGAAGLGFAMGPVVVGGGGVHATSTSSSSQDGGRRTSASEEQRLRDNIRRFGDSLRQLESVVINEVSQEESVTGTTEVVRNLNYGHSLTVIYHQILRHLRVETGVAGVRECLFVPFAMVPFTLERAYRWRETIQARLLSRRHLLALRYLKDVMTGFATSEIPPGRRSDQPIVSLHGSLYLNLALERPKDASEETYNPTLWGLVAPFLGHPAYGIFSRLRAMSEAARDRTFQAEYAPTAAAKWVDTLQLQAGSIVLNADFTLATRYQFNRPVRVDFTVAVPTGLTREDLTNLTVMATRSLPPGSVANLTRLTYEYQTNHFRSRVDGPGGTDDLISVTTGDPDTSGAARTTVPTAWERQNMQLELTNAAKDLIQHLNEHLEYYHKAIWWDMDRDRLFMLVDGFYVPGTPGVSIASVVERDPIAIVGNCLVFRVSSGAFLGIGDLTTPAELHNYYVANQIPRDPMHVSLPTDGLYAQTIMDECDALEEHFGNTDWALDQPDPDLGTLDPSLLLTRRAEPPAATPTPLPATIINLQSAPEAPAPSGLQGVLNAVTTANAFRDMAGLAGTQAMTQASMQAAASLATNFGNQAAALEMAKVAGKAQATGTADQKVASIERARDKGLLTEDQAQTQTEQVFQDLSQPSSAALPHREGAMVETIRAARSMPGSVIEAATTEGTIKVALGSGGAALPAAAAMESAIVLELGKSDDSRAFVEAMEAEGVVDATPGAQQNDAGSEWISYWKSVPPAWWLDRFAATQPTWLYLSGHFAGDRLYNFDDSFSLRWNPATRDNNELWKRYEDDSAAKPFGLNERCEVVVVVGCSIITYPQSVASLQTMLAVAGRNPVILGFHGVCPADERTKVLCREFVAALKADWANRLVDANLAAAWLAAAQVAGSVGDVVGYADRDGKCYEVDDTGAAWTWVEV